MKKKMRRYMRKADNGMSKRIAEIWIDEMVDINNVFRSIRNEANRIQVQGDSKDSTSQWIHADATAWNIAHQVGARKRNAFG